MCSKYGFNFEEVTDNFKFEGEFIKAEPYGYGHINDTFAAYFRKSDGVIHRYLIQRINHIVFKSPEKLMGNIEKVTGYLQKKIWESGGDPKREALNLISARQGKCFYRDKGGNYWRSYIFIEGARTYQTVENPRHLYNAGKAFGKFQYLLKDYPADSLYEVIPNFHNTKERFNAFIKAMEIDIKDRAADVRPEIRFVEERAHEMSILVELIEAGKLPLRVTHNDTKFNNVMIDDATGEGVCVIDLDTIMQGSSLYDFGDAIRSGTNPSDEDERDLTKVWMDLNLFEHFVKGFLELTRCFLTPAELKYLALSARIITYECGMRFLTDYLDGDIYFKVHRKGHNADRARAQFKMVLDMERKYEKMEGIVKKYC